MKHVSILVLNSLIFLKRNYQLILLCSKFQLFFSRLEISTEIVFSFLLSENDKLIKEIKMCVCVFSSLAMSCAQNPKKSIEIINLNCNEITSNFTYCVVSAHFKWCTQQPNKMKKKSGKLLVCHTERFF